MSRALHGVMYLVAVFGCGHPTSERTTESSAAAAVRTTQTASLPADAVPTADAAQAASAEPIAPAPPVPAAPPTPPTQAELEAFADGKTMGFLPGPNVYAAFTVPLNQGYDWTARALTFDGPNAPQEQVFEDEITYNLVHREPGKGGDKARRRFFAKYGARISNALVGATFVPALPRLKPGKPVPLDGTSATLALQGNTIVMQGTARKEHTLTAQESLDAAFLFPTQRKLALLIATPNEEFAPTRLVLLDVP